ncbi:MAG: flagellar biosynthesis protein FlhB [Gammaproteobacteria bacterium]|nr:flagellar biosynthesis protein FlhB [Gammaproteobacteria bacterium]MDH5652174.1 flagellar biosynthesis protein FlhB [Gammaproteobacteria bacterium]
MAEDTGQERTQEASPRRLQQARERGQIPHSRELNTTLMLMLSGLALWFLGPGLASGMAELVQTYLNVSRANAFDPNAMTLLFKQAIFDALYLLLPFFIIVTLAAVAGPLALSGGFNFSTEAIAFKWEKLDPIKGMKRVFALRGLVELLKALVKFLIIGIVAVIFLYSQADHYLNLSDEPVKQGLVHTAQLLIWGFIAIASTMILIAAVDVPFQIWDYQQQLKMTNQEVKDENKDTEGSPEVRARVRRMQRDIAQQRMMADVPKADVIVTNPEHYSVALKYDPERMNAPVVIAKGVDIIAFRIRSIASEHNIPIVTAPPLARALHYTTSLNQEIPAGLYLAVAQVLAYVFQLKRRARSWKQRSDIKMNNLSIPDDMQF